MASLLSMLDHFEQAATEARTELVAQRGYIQHWIDDVAADLKPTTGSLRRALADIDTAIAKADRDELHAARRAIMEAFEAATAGVKPLVWTPEPPYSVARVPSLHLFYATECVWNESKFEFCQLSGNCLNEIFPTLAAAKTAAQSDYETRIRAALVPQPSPAIMEAFEALEAELEDMQATFDIRWKADMRAIKGWQEVTGRERVWPDHVDLVHYLMMGLDIQLSENEKSEKREAELVKALEPFADMGGEMFARGWDATNVALALDNPDDPHRVTAGDFFAARAAIRSIEQE